jgi:copper chaperone
MVTITLQVEGMTCDHCKQTVEGTLKKVPGVQEARVDLEKKTATVRYDETKTNETALKKVVEEQGYDVT